MEKKNVPQLRFKEFENEWEEKALGECFTERNERSSEGDLISVTINNGIKKADELERFVHIADKSNYKVVKKGDIAYNTMRMWQGASGYSPYSGILSPAYTVLCPNENTDSLFHSYLFKKPDMIHLFEINSQGLTSDTWNLKYDAFSEIRTNITSKIEQQKIGSFLSDINSLIQTKTKKLEILKSVKKSLLQKCFPKNGEKVPQMRFEGFSGDWEEKKLGEIAKEIKRTNINSNAPIMMITAENGFIEQKDRYSFNNAGESLKKYIILRQNELAYNHGASKSRPFGSCFDLKIKEARIPFVYHCFSVENVLPDFLSIELNNLEIQKQLKLLVTSGARMDGLLNISFTDYISIKILIPPTLAEQQKIGQFFSKYDSLISLQQKEIENLKTIKKSLLQKMFV